MMVPVPTKLSTMGKRRLIPSVYLLTSDMFSSIAMPYSSGLLLLPLVPCSYRYSIVGVPARPEMALKTSATLRIQCKSSYRWNLPGVMLTPVGTVHELKMYCALVAFSLCVFCLGGCLKVLGIHSKP